MRDLFSLALLLFCMVLMVILYKNNVAFDQTVKEYETQKKAYQVEKEALEKEIRLLKTDLYIMQNGYEGGKENGKD